MTYAHHIWFPITDVAPTPLQPTKILHTEGAQTNWELWQMERYGNYIKAVGSEHAERFISSHDKKEKV